MAIAAGRGLHHAALVEQAERGHGVELVRGPVAADEHGLGSLLGGAVSAQAVVRDVADVLR